ncbi:hypothetical protein D3C80_2150500 [compost metagenome]
MPFPAVQTEGYGGEGYDHGDDAFLGHIFRYALHSSRPPNFLLLVVKRTERTVHF